MDPHTELYHTLVSLLSDEELLRLQKRITLQIPDSVAGYHLLESLNIELMGREILHG